MGRSESMKGLHAIIPNGHAEETRAPIRTALSASDMAALILRAPLRHKRGYVRTQPGEAAKLVGS